MPAAPRLDLDQRAKRSKAIERERADGRGLPRLALARGPGGLSLRQTAAWAEMTGLGELRDPAVKYRLDKAVPFLKAVMEQQLAAHVGSTALRWAGRIPRAACPEFPRLAKPFGIADLRFILARITTAVRRVVLLEHSVIRRAGVGRYAVPPRTRNPSPRKPRAAVRPDAAPRQDRSPTPARPARKTGNPLIPTTAQLAAELRRHPAGVVLAGICRDLGITPHHPLWDEVSHAIAALGGSVAELEQDADTRWCSRRWLEIPVARPDSVPA